MPVPAIGVIFHSRFPPEASADYARRSEAGIDSTLFQPLDSYPECLDEYIR